MVGLLLRLFIMPTLISEEQSCFSLSSLMWSFMFVCCLYQCFFFLVVVTSLERLVIGILSIQWTGKDWGENHFLVQTDSYAQRQSGSSVSVPKWDLELPLQRETAARSVAEFLCCPLSLLPSAERMLSVSECLAILKEGKIRRQHLCPIGKGNVNIIVATRTQEVPSMGTHQF